MESVGVPMAIGVGMDGRREVIAAAEGMKEDAASWNSFVSSLPGRGLTGVRPAAGAPGSVCVYLLVGRFGV